MAEPEDLVPEVKVVMEVLVVVQRELQEEVGLLQRQLNLLNQEIQELTDLEMQVELLQAATGNLPVLVVEVLELQVKQLLDLLELSVV